jgi:hypothetical protein
MKKIIIMVSTLVSCISHADTSIPLQKLSDSKACQNIDKLIISDDSGKSEDFSIPDEDYLILRLSDTQKNGCYSFKYFPCISPDISFFIKNKKLTINEIAGSTLNGNQIRTSYSINLKKKRLDTLTSEMITFDRDEKGNVVKVVSNLLE